ncbi:DUF2169 domain-containing protein [Mesorhizobium sp. BR1-1-13]|uniref:DUF2169 family type VI secretion system accessory protein n=1 Tax=Mesorhizobium sp. BR1-1-13 TaxID=2876656 RepID=UPI001CD1350F|nr:DUF2169 domain-containing protein [Mesorhizobium sp. BR1-1-13]MBZ9942458.1 DUF2169 domain-containing protein [Mesorhizobium sp. BR1-1-13]
MPFDILIENKTSFTAGSIVQLDADGQENFVVVLSASFSVSEDGAIVVAEEQVPVIFGDEPFRDGAFSSNRYEADIASHKPGVEVIVNGMAYAPGGKPVQEMQVGLRIGSVRKVLRVVGDRSLAMGSFSAPDPFVKMAIVYERAFGGATADGRVYEKNPVGIGFGKARSPDTTVTSEAPNIFYPTDNINSLASQPRPAGFGVIGRGWQPRLKLAGTYDPHWIDTQWPLPPKDFDPRYNLCAPADQQMERLVGNDQVSLVGMTKNGRWDFRLPHVIAPVHLVYADRVEYERFIADTIIIEPDLSRVTLKSRFCRIIERIQPPLLAVVFGYVTPAYLLAMRKRKTHLPLGAAERHTDDRPQWSQ